MDKVQWLVRDYVEAFNRGVETDDWRRWFALLTPDIVLRFRGDSEGPFVGPKAIATAYRRRRPDDEIEVLDVHERDGHVIIGYSWLRDPDIRAGEMRWTLSDGLIQEIEITT